MAWHLWCAIPGRACIKAQPCRLHQYAAVMMRKKASFPRPLQVADTLLDEVSLSGGHLRIGWISDLPSLPRLLSALVPPSLPAFSQLSLCSCRLPLEALQFGDERGSGTALVQLRELSFDSCHVSGGSWSEALAALMGAAPSLGSLEMQRCLSETGIPDSVRSATHLTSLSLQFNDLEELPEAPVLAGGQQVQWSTIGT